MEIYKFDDEQLADLIVNICKKQNMTGEDNELEAVTEIANWVHHAVIAYTILEWVKDELIELKYDNQIKDLVFTPTPAFEIKYGEYLGRSYENSPIWQQIGDIIEQKDALEFDQ